MPDLQQPTMCHVCGKPCLTEHGDFGLPIKDISNGQPITGVCCGICGPAIEAYCASNCQDFDLLPDGPLKERLYHLRNLYMGMRCLDIVVWLAEHHATVDFHSSQLVAGANADQVTVEARLDHGETMTATGQTLELVVAELMAAEPEPEVIN